MLTVETLRLDTGMNWYEQSMTPTDRLTFVVVTYGRCIYWIEQEKVVAERGDFLLIPADKSYYGKSVPTVFHEKLVISFRVSETMRASLPLLTAPIWLKSKAGIYELCLERLRTMKKDWDDTMPYANIRAAATLIETLALWSRELDRRAEAPEIVSHVDRMKQYIGTHYREQITKEELGDHIGRSPNHAATLFSRVTGQTISSYVHAIRIRTAVYMLTESLLTISEISEYLGYKDVSYFQKIFKRTLGNSPSVYMKERR